MKTAIAMIREVVNWPHVQYQVIYKSGRHIYYSEKDTLPMSIVNFILSSEITVRVRYAGNSPFATTKVTTYKYPA